MRQETKNKILKIVNQIKENGGRDEHILHACLEVSIRILLCSSDVRDQEIGEKLTWFIATNVLPQLVQKEELDV